jgi:hypothetical protein
MALLSKGTSGFFKLEIAMYKTITTNKRNTPMARIPHRTRCQRPGLAVWKTCGEWGDIVIND